MTQVSGDVSSERRARWVRLAWVAAYAVAMAWLEAAVVLYLRTLTGEYNPARPIVTPLSNHLILAESSVKPPRW